MAETVGQHSVAAFTSPVNGTSPIDANTVKGNDNTIRSAYVDHDADPGIHVQSSTLASRPVANSAGRKWMTQDSGVIRLFYDDGTSWYEVDYLRTTGGTISGNLAITGTLAVTGVATFTAQPILSSLTASRAVFTDGSKGLVSNAITGTGDVVMSASPTLTGTITAASATLSGTLGVSGLLTFASLKGTGATTVTNILDEDNMASDSATALATQQSIKAYVDAQVGASDALSEVLAIGNTTGANDIIVSAGQKIRTPAVAAQDGSSAITIANTTGALTLATALADSNLATISTAGKVSNSATTATSANTASAIVARDASGNFSAGTITATLNGAAPAGSLTGTTLASNVVTSSLTAVGTIATGVWQGTAISDTYLATISTAGKVSNSATTATSANTASAIVARDASGNFTAGTITAALTGNASTATTLQTARNINGVSFNGSADITVTAAAGTLTGTTLASNVTASSLTSVGTLANLTVTNPITGSVTGSSGSTTGNAATATALQTARNINGVSFNGTADITVTAAAGTLTGTTLASGVTASSLTSVGTLTSLTVSGAATMGRNAVFSHTTNPYVRLAKTNATAVNWDIQANSDNSFNISDGTPRLVIDASGNLAVDTNTLYVDAANNRVGVGTATPTEKFEVMNGAVASTNGTVATVLAYSSVGIVGTSTNHALTFVTNGTERMRLDASGNLGLGVTPSYRLDVSGDIRAVTTGTTRYIIAGSDTQGAVFQQRAQASWGDAFQVYRAGNLKWALQEGSDAFIVSVNSAERARITSGGYFKASPNGTYNNATGTYHEFVSTSDNTGTVVVKHTGTSGAQYGITITTVNDQNDATRYFWSGEGAGVERGTLRSNGGLANYSANNVNLASDFRLKKDIAPLASTWDKLKAIEVVNFRYKDCNEDDPALYGVIAQQVQPIVPELVVVTREAVEAQDAVLDEDGNEVEPAVEAKPEYYGIREQPMYWLAIKALQEAQARIESLEARLAALES